MNKNNKIRPIYVLIFIMSILTIIKLCALYFGWGNYFSSLIWAFDDRTLFYDHFDHIKYCLLGGIKDVYWVYKKACFPAFAYLFYGFLAHLCSVDQVDTTEYTHIYNTNSGMITLVFMYGIIFVLVALLVYKFLEKAIGSIASTWLVIQILLSSIFLMTVASGNFTIGAMLLILASLYFRDSESPILREISMILLAMAASLKVYPAVLGFLYLKEKRYKETIRLIIYGILFFFVPFIFFGGVAGFVQFVINLYGESKIVTDITLVGILELALRTFLDGETALMIAKIVDIIYLLMTFFIVFMRKKIDWKTYALLSGLMFAFNSEAGSYCMIYWTVALVYFAKEIGNKEDAKLLEYIYACFLAMSFSALPIGGVGSSVIPATFLYATIIAIMIDGLAEIILKR